MCGPCPLSDILAGVRGPSRAGDVGAKGLLGSLGWELGSLPQSSGAVGPDGPPEAVSPPRRLPRTHDSRKDVSLCPLLISAFGVQAGAGAGPPHPVGRSQASLRPPLPGALLPAWPRAPTLGHNGHRACGGQGGAWGGRGLFLPGPGPHVGEVQGRVFSRVTVGSAWQTRVSGLPSQASRLSGLGGTGSPEN